MSVSTTGSPLQLPTSLQTQLAEYRRRVWTIKTAEAVGIAVTTLLAAWLVVFGLDRLVDTPVGARLPIALAALAGCAIVPVWLYRWVWCRRRREQLARLISDRQPHLGDQLLGVIELVHSESEQVRSRALCDAAVRQVADVASRQDLLAAAPSARHRLWMALAIAATAGAVTLAVLFPEAAANAWTRFALPWGATPRYTFTAVVPLPERVVVPHGEPVTIPVALQVDTRWRPDEGLCRLGNQQPVSASLRDGQYEFALPGQIEPAWLEVWIGDARQTVRVEPMLRPELSAVEADVQLPDYLGRTQGLHKDVRGGSVGLVTGSRATFTVTANRGLSSATVDGASRQPSNAQVVSAPVEVEGSRKVAFEWTDEFGLQGQEPFVITISARDDESPSISCEDLPRQKVVLVSETLNFKLHAQDDFGIRVVGLEWKGLDPSAATSAKGDRVLAAGGNDREMLEMAGTFNAENLEIDPQPVAVRIYVEDYCPEHQRVYSPTYTLFVLSAEQHFIWLTEQLSKWHRQSLEVRDREMQLHHTNQQLRLLNPAELDDPATRRRIEAQSTAERANGRRLAALTSNGEELVRQAMRNPEFGVGHLDKWAEMLQILQDISANRMPNVADLLKQSAQAKLAQSNKNSKSGPQAGQVRDTQSSPAHPAGENQPKPPAPAIPTVADRESSQQPANKDAQPEKPSESKSKPRLTLPVTTVAGYGSKKSDQPPAAEKLEEAVVAQQDLLAEFEKISDELNKVLANLEGSTLLKRLKAASRKQYVVAGKIGDQLNGAFGQLGLPAEQRTALGELAHVEAESSLDVSAIMDDMQAYFERRRFQRFKTVLDEMRQQDAVGSLRQLGDDVTNETGMSIAQCEFWSDAMDRWADDLVDPASCGKCPGCKSKSSLPPSVVLEAMKILESEVNLREETRGAEQARKALEPKEYASRSGKLATGQAALSKRVADLTVRIRELPDGDSEFAPEIKLLNRVELVMDEATDLLKRPDTGAPTIAAETEAIELLLQSKRINPRGGGGGGSSPGGGGSGNTNDTALALIGLGVNEKEIREDRAISQTTGESGNALPEEFRAGLDEYFSRLEREAQP